MDEAAGAVPSLTVEIVSMLRSMGFFGGIAITVIGLAVMFKYLYPLFKRSQKDDDGHMAGEQLAALGALVAQLNQRIEGLADEKHGLANVATVLHATAEMQERMMERFERASESFERAARVLSEAATRMESHAR